jgi:phosphomevalonate kinase
MGSSASLVVAFLGAIKAYFNLSFNLHAHAQLLNAVIQSKIGSGFDISAALYGTQFYRRFTNID